MGLYALKVALWNYYQKRRLGIAECGESADEFLTVQEQRATKHERISLVMTDTDVSETGERKKYKLTFKTKHDHVEAYSNEVLDKICNILKKKVNEDDIVCDFIDHHKAAVQMIVAHKGDTLEKNRSFKKAMKLLKDEAGVSKIRLVEIDTGEQYQDLQQEYVELSFKTKGPKVETFSVGLVIRMMKDKAFKAKVHEKEVNVTGDEKAVITFILNQSADTAMDDLTIQKMLDLLQGQERVNKINLKVVEDLVAKRKSMHMKRVKRLSSRKFISHVTKRTQAVLLAFEVIGQGAKQHGYKLIDQITDIKGFKNQIHGKKLKMVNAKKSGSNAQITMVICQKYGKDPLENPKIKAVRDMLMAEKMVRKVKVNMIPYFL